MNISVLGPVEVSAGGRPVAIGAGKPRALLALLALHEGSTVPTERLVEGLWGEDPPATAVKMVQACVSQLRQALAAAGDGAQIVTRGRGYELRLGDGGLDARRFERLIAECRPREALALWRGAPLADVADEPFAAAEIRRLEELRLTAIEQAIDGDLVAGRHREVVGELEGLVAQEPLRERLHAQRMLALYRSGRQAEALEAYREARRVLVEAIGVEPGPELRRLQEAILRQDPSLEPPVQLAIELPAELDVGTPLAGREAEVDWLREHWRAAHAGAGRLVLVAGEPGIGKPRLAAELAAEVHRDRGAVLYASDASPPAAARVALDRARAARPALVVLDDLDRAGGELRSALVALLDGLAARPVLVVATGEDRALGSELGVEATLTLRPLDAEGVAAIARLYAREDAEVPVERLVEASGGVPRRVHRAAGEWARAQAARRVSAAVDRAVSERTGLRAAEDDVAGTVVELQAVSERAERQDTELGVVACPFKGLAAFDVDDAGIFFGRERLVAEMVARLAGAPLMGIVGPSGSGKSSALRAGLLAALAAGVLPGSEGWALALLRPGEHPPRALEQTVAEAPPCGQLVVAVDQFEEVFTACREESERAAFVDALVACTRDPRRRAVVLVAARADFYGRCAVYPELWRLLGATQVPVGPMRRDELRRAIELPARRAGLQVEPELADALIADVEGEPGALPLLSTSLLELWQHRDGRRLRLAAYEQAGGVQGAVARLAEGAYTRLDASQQRIARAILLRLAGEGEGDSVVRRRVALAELEGERDEAVGEVLSVLAADRLVTIGAGEVEVAHEALLREWPRLRSWLEEDAEGRRLHHHLIRAARDWQSAGRDRAELYRGARLASALDWAAGHEREPNELEREFIAQSRAEAESQAERQRRTNRRLRALLASLAVLLALAVAAGVVALNQRGQASDAARAAQAQRLGTQALTENDLDRSLLLARQGLELDDSPATRSNLLTALLRAPAAVGVIRGTGNPLLALDLSPSGRTLAVGDSRGAVLLFDVATRRRVGPLYNPGGGVGALRFSPDGRRLAIIGMSSVDLIDARSHKTVGHLFANPAVPTNFDSVLFSSDSRVIAAGSPAFVGRQSPIRHYIQRWNALAGRPLGDARSIPGAPVGFIAGNTLLVTSGPAGTDVRDAATLRPIRHWRGGGAPATVSPNGRTLAYGARDGSVHFVDLRTGRLRVAVGRHDAGVTALRFLPDSRAVVSAAADGQLIVWDVKRGTRSETLENPTGGVSDLAIARGGRTAYTAGQNGSVIAWDLSGARRLARPFRLPRWDIPAFPAAVVPDVATSPDGEMFAIPERTGYADLFDSQTLARIGRIRLSAGALAKVAIAPDGRTIAATSLDGRVVFSGLLTRRPLGPPIPAGSGPPAFALAFSADRRWLATTSGETATIWDAQRRTFVKGLTPGGLVADVSLSPDGTTLAATVDNGPGSGELDIVSVPFLKSIAHVPAPEGRWGRFSRDGRLLLYGDQAGRAWLFDARTWTPRGKPLVGHTDALLTVSLSPDDQMLATTSLDGTTRLWDVPSGRAIGTALPGVPNHRVSGAFVDGGRGFVTAYDNGRGYLWDVRAESWARRACDVAGRTLTHHEWQDVLPERDYAPACARP
jgi:WD40 repeat protein/DNA-binding SARP family transcriptional activator